jgi:hypothetical protein
MKQRSFILLAILALALWMALEHLPVQASAGQVQISGWATVTDQPEPGKCIHPDRLRICRDRAAVIQLETNDARSTGMVAIAFDSFTTKAPYTERIEGDFRLDHGGGSWVGTWQGSTDSQGYTIFTVQGQGSDDYAGLVIHLQMGRSSSNRWEPMSLSGIIDKMSLPARRR